MTTTVKTCFKCGQVKPLAQFYVHKNMADGHLNKCIPCAKNDTSSRRHGAKRESVLAYDRARSNLPHRAQKRLEICKRWMESHPDRRSAQNTLNNAVRDGIVTPLPCFVCGKKAEAHHPDYSRPIDVVWLCRVHHAQAHALVSQEKD